MLMNSFDDLTTKYKYFYNDDSPYKIDVADGITKGHQGKTWVTDKTVSTKPFLPTAIYDNQDEAIQKVEVSLWDRSRWKTTVANREVLCNASKVVKLADFGFPIGTHNAKDTAQYFTVLLGAHDGEMPHRASRSVMGWAEIDGEKVFMPYTDKLSFDGEEAYKHLYSAVSERGTLDEWVTFMQPVRAESLEMRLVMAASFASPLIDLIAENPFILHVWAETGSGKTVALMAAMSIWGEPTNGKMLRSLNMTMNSMLSTAAFLNSIPFAGDELQTLKTRWSKSYDQIIMQITEGVDRGRMQNDKLLRTKSWRNAFIFSGEEPIIKQASGGGAVNRVVQVEVDPKKKITERGNAIANFTRSHYGAVGRPWVEYLRSKQSRLTEEYQMVFQEIMSNSDTTEKQAGAAAILFLADNLASARFWPDERKLQIADVVPFLASKSQVDNSERAYEFVIGSISENASNFQNGAIRQWGSIEGNTVRINKNVLIRIMADEGFDFDACKKKWQRTGKLMLTHDGKFARFASVNGIRGQYVTLAMPDEDDQPSLTEYKGEVPF